MKNKIFKSKTYLLFILSLIVASCSSDDDAAPEESVNNVEILQGDWFRVGGNNPSNNGMLVNVSNTNGTVVNPEQSVYQVGDIKWKDILSQGNGQFTHLELGSDNTYYTATMELNVDDTLRISVASSGAGNIQKWIREFPETELDDCIPQTPIASDGGFQGSWEEINEVDAFSITAVPGNELSNGIVTATIETNEPVVPCFNLFAGSDLNTGLITGNNGTSSRTYRIVGQPGTLFSGETTDCENAPSDQYPWDYNVSWTYSSILDCYEPNNTFEQAKAVPKNQSVSAMGVAGHTDGGLGVYDPSTYDWYKVTINQPSKLRMTLNQCPSDIHMHFRFFKNVNGNPSTLSMEVVEINGEAHAPGSTYYIQTSNVLEPGTYFLEGHRLRGQGVPEVVADDEPNPEHWGSPYSFIVTTED